MKLSQRLGLTLILLFMGISTSYAKLTLSRLFSDHMVLQRDMEIPVWGWDKPGKYIQLNVDGKQYFTTAGDDGRFTFYLPPHEAGGPYDIEVISPSETLVVKDILFGEVWLCGGQSNMEYTLNMLNKKEAISKAKDDHMRFFWVDKRVAFSPTEKLDKGNWALCNPQTVGNFSAVGYFFAQKLREELDVPVGLIYNNWGGTVVETWLSPEAASEVSYYKEALEALKTYNPKENQKRVAKLYQKLMKKMGNPRESGMKGENAIWAEEDYDDSKWGELEVPGLWEGQGYPELNGLIWMRYEFELPEFTRKDFQLSLGKIDDSDMTWINGRLVGQMEQQYSKARNYKVAANYLKPGKNVIAVRVHDTGGGGGFWSEAKDLFIQQDDLKVSLAGKWKFRISGKGLKLDLPGEGPNDQPTFLYNGMIHAVKPYGMRGVIWYQGESNADRGEEYQQLFPALIKDWRKQWERELSFYFVQLANFMSPSDQPGASNWAELREAQSKTLSLPKTGMAVAIDIGDAEDIHPTNKEDVGLRLALNALAKDYGKEIEYAGPTYSSMKVEGNKIVLSFDHVGKGLMAKGDSKYQYLTGFTIAGADQEFHWAQAFISGDDIIVLSPKVAEPKAVRYGWADNPDDVNLYNKDGLPASPFRTDNWPLSSAGKVKTYLPASE